MVTVAEKFENTVQPVVALCFHPGAIKDVDHEAFWQVHAPNCSMTDCDESLIEKSSRRLEHTARLHSGGRVEGCLSRCH